MRNIVVIGLAIAVFGAAIVQSGASLTNQKAELGVKQVTATLSSAIASPSMPAEDIKNESNDTSPGTHAAPPSTNIVNVNEPEAGTRRGRRHTHKKRKKHCGHCGRG